MPAIHSPIPFSDLRNLRNFNRKFNAHCRRHKLRGFQITLFREWHLNEVNIRFEELEVIMAKSKDKKAKNEMFGGYEFAQVHLEPEDLTLYDQWAKEHQEDFVFYMQDLLTSDWKLSFTWDDDGDCYLASCTMKDDDDVNKKLVLTSRSNEPFDAALMCYYKIKIMFEGKRLPVEKQSRNRG